MSDPLIIRNAESYDLDTCEHMDNGVSVQMCPNGHSKNLARHSKASQVFSDGFSDGENGISEQDTRERLEAWAHEEIAEKWAQGDREVTMIMDDLHDLLDRQAAITERKASERHEKFCAECEQVTDGRIAELTATCDALREQREYWFNEAVTIYRRFYPHDEYSIPSNIAEMVLAKVDELQATNKPNSQFDVLKTAENAENATSKNEIRNFDDSRERLEADVRFVVKAWKDSHHDFPKACPDVVLDSIFKWLDRQAAITKRECYESEAWRLGITRDAIECGETVGIFGREYVPADLADGLQAELETYRKYADQGECAKPQSEKNGDTREQLEADIRKRTECSWVTAPHEKVIDWLDRQAAITRYIERGMHDVILDNLERENDELTAERDKLKGRLENQAAYIAGVEDDLCRCESQLVRDGKDIDELTAERDEWKAKAEYQQEILDCDCRDLRDFQNEIDSLTAKRDELQAAIDAMELGQFYSMYLEKHDECEQLKRANRIQADSFRKLEADYARVALDLAKAKDGTR